jgi:hypothetical protein
MPVRAKLWREEPWYGKVWVGLSAEHWCAPLPAGQRWDASRWNEERYCCREFGRRRVHNCCDWPPRRRRRDSFRHHPW